MKFSRSIRDVLSDYFLVYVGLFCILVDNGNAILTTSQPEDEETCWPLNRTYFDQCTNVGINASFSHHFLSFEEEEEEEETELSIANGIREELEDFVRDLHIESCSNYTDLITCSLHLPQCVGNGRSLREILPCRRVCEEFVTDCQKQLPRHRLDYFVGVCNFLPEKGCIEPANFKSKYNSSELLGQSCTKVITKQCKFLNYNYTIASEEMQRDAEEEIESSLSEESESCRPLLAKFLCIELVSPCFPNDKTPTLHLPCNTTCTEMSKKCSIIDSDYDEYGEDFSICQYLPGIKGDRGYCMVSHWDQLYEILYHHHEKEEIKQMKRGMTAGKIAAFVLVPVVLVIIAITLVLILRKHCQRKAVTQFSPIRYKRGDEEPIVCEESETNIISV